MASHLKPDDAARPDAAGRRVVLAGVPVDVIGEADILALLDHAARGDARLVLANANLHGLYCALRSPAMLELLRHPDTIVHIDGTPVLWAARPFVRRIPPRARNAHIDLVPRMLAVCAREGWPVAMIGADAAGAARNEEVLAGLAPGLRVAAFPGYFDMRDLSDGSEQSRIVAAVHAFRPKLLLVGMGMPRQEEWIAAMRGRLDVPVVMPVGGFADYFAGRARMPPRGLGPLGLEWLFRLACDPRRLGFRYLVEPLLLAGLMLRATLRGAKWGRDAGPAPS